MLERCMNGRWGLPWRRFRFARVEGMTLHERRQK